MPITPNRFWQTWNADMPLFVSLLFVAWLYNQGLAKLWRRVGFGRGVRYWQAGAFVAGLLTIGVALLSPIEALSHVLFSGHMLQHLLLISVAAPLLALSGLQVALLTGLPRSWQRQLAYRWNQAAWLHKLWRFISQPAVTWIVGVGIVWMWHVPILYQLALTNDAIHVGEHVMFLLASMLFWWTLLKPGQPRYATYGVHVFYLFTATLQGSALGALMTFSGQAWYPAYASTTPLWNLTPLQDQQLAGLIMWLPSGLLYLGAALIFFVRWLNALESHMQIAGGQ